MEDEYKELAMGVRGGDGGVRNEESRRERHRNIGGIEWGFDGSMWGFDVSRACGGSTAVGGATCGGSTAACGGLTSAEHLGVRRQEVGLLYTSPSPRDAMLHRMPSSARHYQSSNFIAPT